jgi:hypothetical protein
MFVNESGTSELLLHEDSTYEYTFPNFFGKISEKGNFEINNESLILYRNSLNDIDSINTSFSYPFDRKPESDSLLLTFKDLHSDPINVIIQFNNSSEKFETSEPGIIFLAYKDLEDLGIIKINQKVKNVSILYEDKHYFPDLSYFEQSERPKRIDFTLNQFIGKDYAVLKRVYRFENDTIYINDISRKSIGKQNKLVKIK